MGEWTAGGDKRRHGRHAVLWLQQMRHWLLRRHVTKPGATHLLGRVDSRGGQAQAPESCSDLRVCQSSSRHGVRSSQRSSLHHISLGSQGLRLVQGCQHSLPVALALAGHGLQSRVICKSLPDS